jgi:hypothetical protein
VAEVGYLQLSFESFFKDQLPIAKTATAYQLTCVYWVPAYTCLAGEIKYKSRMFIAMIRKALDRNLSLGSWIQSMNPCPTSIILNVGSSHIPLHASQAGSNILQTAPPPPQAKAFPFLARRLPLHIVSYTIRWNRKLRSSYAYILLLPFL